MHSNTRTVILTMIGAVLLVVLGFFGRDFLRSNPEQIDCGDGARHTIDIRDFTTQYWAYSGEFEASIADKGKLSGKLDPKQLQAVSDASQQMNEFRKYVVAGFNSCAITKQQYGELGSRFQQLDGLSRRIDGLGTIPNPTDSDKAQLGKLVDEYVALTQQLAKSPGQ
ncbi:hypothetical protein [Nitrosospira briensis]|uniref:hypothetical protein n=1 Tax=Nitrosospira briensis TaxID=35799 RepID=UPI0008E0EF6F|nr:hypothetical protein [Nitrosospira briensis]SFN67372.1 hypothetical protein SAMN05216332_101150 [Nitrosospira briensis]